MSGEELSMVKGIFKTISVNISPLANCFDSRQSVFPTYLCRSLTTLLHLYSFSTWPNPRFLHPTHPTDITGHDDASDIVSLHLE